MRTHRVLVTLTVANVALCLGAFVAFPMPPADATRQAPTQPPSLLEAALANARSDDPARRLAAVRVLGALADPSARPVLEELRHAEETAVATEAAHALVRTGRDAGPLLERIFAGLDEQGAVSALADCEGRSVDDALKLLAMPRDAVVRGAALRLFARRFPGKAVSMIRDALESDEDVLRHYALEAAVRSPDRTFETALRRCAESDDWVERRLALGALAGAGDGASMSHLLVEADAHDPWDALFVAEIAAWARCPGAARAWCNALHAVSARDRPAALCRFRGEIPDCLREPMRAHLTDGEPAVRVAAALTLSSVGDASGLAVLRDAVASESDPLSCADAAVALARLERR